MNDFVHLDEQRQSLETQMPGFVLVVFTWIGVDGSFTEGCHRIFTDRPSAETWVTVEDVNLWDWSMHPYTFKNGEWIED